MQLLCLLVEYNIMLEGGLLDYTRFIENVYELILPLFQAAVILVAILTVYWIYTGVPGRLQKVVKDDSSTLVGLLVRPQKSNKNCTSSSSVNECRTGPNGFHRNETINWGSSLTLTDHHTDEEVKPAIDFREEYFLKYFPRLNTKKMMIYTCAEWRSCGGLGDRLRGLYSVYILSVFLNRTFGIEIKRPCSIENFIQPNVLDWRVPPNVSDNKTIGRAKFLNAKAPPLTVEQILEKVPDADIVHLTINQDYINVFKFYKPENDSFHKPGNETFIFLKNLINSDIHGIIYHGLFKLKDPLEEELNNFFNMKIGDNKLISAHIRIGDPWVKPRIPQKDLDKIWTWLIQYRNLSEYKIFIASDNQEVKTVAYHLFGDQYVGFSEKIIHIDIVKYRNDTACQGHRFSLLEHAILARSDTLLLTKSGFGIEAAYIRQRRDQLYCYLVTDGVIPCTPGSLKALYKR